MRLSVSGPEIFVVPKLIRLLAGVSVANISVGDGVVSFDPRILHPNVSSFIHSASGLSGPLRGVQALQETAVNLLPV